MADPSLTPWDLKGKVTVVGKSIQGGFSSVSKGTLKNDDGTEVEVAVKSLRIEGVDSPAEATDRLHKRFGREAILWFKLKHPNIVPLLGYMMEPTPALISPWCSKGNMIDFLKSHPDSNRHRLALDIVNGLDYLHSYPVAHGDLKGDNVLVDSEGHAMLCDFGMSRFLDEKSYTAGFTTANSNIGGTVRFMSPELLEDKPKTTATDMWALGCLIVLILTDIIPYWNISRKEAVLAAILRGVLPVEVDVFVIDASLRNCISKCWSAKQEDRPKAHELKNHLTQLTSRKYLGDLVQEDRVEGEQINRSGVSHISKGTLQQDGVGMEVAVKSLRVEGILSEEQMDSLRMRFYREALMWRDLKHPNIVPLIGYMMLPPKPPALISPWYSNGTIIDYLKAFLDADRRALALDVAKGLEYLHSVSVVHGNLNGENVLVDNDGHARLCDFEQSQFIHDASRVEGATAINGNTGETVRFMSPELFDDKPKGLATDIWALGCLIVLILTDVVPYRQIISEKAVLAAILRHTLPVEETILLTDTKGLIDTALWACIRKCWSKPPDKRPDACEFKRHLAPRGTPTNPEPTGKTVMGKKLIDIFGPQKDQPKTGHDLLWIQKLVPSFGGLNSATMKLLNDAMKVAIPGTTAMVAEISPPKREYERVNAEFRKSPLIKQLGDECGNSDSFTRSGTDWFKAESEEKSAAVKEVMAWLEKLVGNPDFLSAARIDLDAVTQIVTKTGKVITKYIDKGTFYTKKLILDFVVLRYPSPEDLHFKLYSIKLYAWVDYNEVTITGDSGIRGECVWQTYAPNDEGIVGRDFVSGKSFMDIYLHRERPRKKTARNLSPKPIHFSMTEGISGEQVKKGCVKSASPAI